MKAIALSCKQAALLGAKSTLDDLSFVENIRLKMHSAICGPCRQYQEDSQLIDEAISKIMDQRKKQSMHLTEEQRDKILKAIS
ncbi:MAG: zf-HC2 domain-containing protein [Bacteroidia bacterium]